MIEFFDAMKPSDLANATSLLGINTRDAIFLNVGMLASVGLPTNTIYYEIYI